MMFDVSVIMDCRPMIVVVQGLLIPNHDNVGWMKDKYERKRTTKHIRKRTETDIYCGFDNTMISVSSYFICPKFD